jgi:predicted MFS family arabinose efflux permease
VSPDTLDRILNGLTRPFFAWVSDKIGRENTMLIAFGLGDIGIWILSMFGECPLTFVISSGFVFFAWGEIYSLFPSTCTDAFGTEYAATNAGLLYTAKGTAALLVPLGNVLTTATGGWHAVFTIAVIMNLVTALSAILLLKPLRMVHETRLKSAPPSRRINLLREPKARLHHEVPESEARNSSRFGGVRHLITRSCTNCISRNGCRSVAVRTQSGCWEHRR